MPHANNKGTDQPAHPRSLISTFVIHCLCRIIPILAKSNFSILYLISVAEQASLSRTWSQTSAASFSRDGAHMEKEEASDYEPHL